MGHELCRLMFWLLNTEFPDNCRENRLMVLLLRLLSSAQLMLAAPRWSISTVKKSSRSRLPPVEQPRPAVQTCPR